MKASAIVALILVFGLLCGLVLGPSKPVAAPQALPENASMFYDSTRQILVHRGILLATVIAGLSLLALRRRISTSDATIAPLARMGALSRALSFGVPVLIFGLALRDLPSLKWAIGAACVAVGIIWFGSGLSERPWRSAVVTVVLLALAMILVVPGFFLTPDLATHAAVPAEFTEVHYSITVSAGDRLSQGGRLFATVMPHYGFLSPFVLAIAERGHSLLGFGTHIRVVQLMQVAFAAAAFLCYWLWSGRKIWPTAVVFLPTLAFVHTLHASVFCPNQSGWRFLGFPLGLLPLVAFKRFDRRASTALGCVLGALVLFNPETGIAMGAGYFTYIVSGHLRTNDSTRAILGSLSRFAVGAATVLLLFLIIFRAALGYYPFPVSHGSSYALTRFAGGYGGLKIYFSVSWIVILLHSLFEIVRSLLSLEALTRRRRVRMAIAVVIVVWFAYFANRPCAWNLWTYWFLYGFFVIDLLRPAALKRFRRLATRGRVPIGLVIVGVFTSAAAFNIVQGMRDVMRRVRREPIAHAAVLSGVELDEAYARTASRRAEFLRSRAAEVPLLYFTSNTYLMPALSGIYCDLPFADPYVESFDMIDFEHSVASILEKRPAELLFDDPASGFVGSKERQIFIARLKSRLAPSYRMSGATAGWEIWKRAA